MRARPPVTRVDAGHLVLRTELTAADGSDLAPLEITVPRERADLLDPTATAAVPTLLLAAAARGEDLASTDRSTTPSPDGSTARPTCWRGGGTARRGRVDIEGPDAGRGHGDGMGLFFTRGVDSWSTLLDLLDGPPDGRRHPPAGRPPRRPTPSGRWRRRSSTATGTWPTSWGWSWWCWPPTSAACSTPTARGPTPHPRPGLRRPGPSAPVWGGWCSPAPTRPTSTPAPGPTPTCSPHLATASIEVVLGEPRPGPRRAPGPHPRPPPGPRAPSRCAGRARCRATAGAASSASMTMSGLLLAGDPDPQRGLRRAPRPGPRPPRSTSAPRSTTWSRGLREDLPPEHEELRRAWADAWATSHGDAPPVRWGTDDPPGLAGPGVARPRRRRPPRRHRPGRGPRAGPLGWRPGAVPLRPALADHGVVRAARRGHATRPRPWAVVESQIRDGARDGTQADLALRCQAAFGAGATLPPGDPDLGLGGPAGARAPTAWGACCARSGPGCGGARTATSSRCGWWRRWSRAASPSRSCRTGRPRPGRRPGPGPRPPGGGRATTWPPSTSRPPAWPGRLGPAVDHLLAGSADRDLIAGALGG